MATYAWRFSPPEAAREKAKSYQVHGTDATWPRSLCPQLPFSRARTPPHEVTTMEKEFVIRCPFYIPDDSGNASLIASRNSLYTLVLFVRPTVNAPEPADKPPKPEIAPPDEKVLPHRRSGGPRRGRHATQLSAGDFHQPLCYVKTNSSRFAASLRSEVRTLSSIFTRG